MQDSAREYDLAIPEYIKRLIGEDQEARYELGHDMGTSCFHDLRDAITAMYLIDDYHRTDDALFCHTPGEIARIRETVIDGGIYRNGIYGLSE